MHVDGQWWAKNTYENYSGFLVQEMPNTCILLSALAQRLPSISHVLKKKASMWDYL